jgi:hypothetical protein
MTKQDSKDTKDTKETKDTKGKPCATPAAGALARPPSGGHIGPGPTTFW